MGSGRLVSFFLPCLAVLVPACSFAFAFCKPPPQARPDQERTGGVGGARTAPLLLQGPDPHLTYPHPNPGGLRCRPCNPHPDKDRRTLTPTDLTPTTTTPPACTVLPSHYPSCHPSPTIPSPTPPTYPNITMEDKFDYEAF